MNIDMAADVERGAAVASIAGWLAGVVVTLHTDAHDTRYWAREASPTFTLAPQSGLVAPRLVTATISHHAFDENPPGDLIIIRFRA
jgi:hypothetical protein